MRTRRNVIPIISIVTGGDVSRWQKEIDKAESGLKARKVDKRTIAIVRGDGSQVGQVSPGVYGGEWEGEFQFRGSERPTDMHGFKLKELAKRIMRREQGLSNPKPTRQHDLASVVTYALFALLVTQVTFRVWEFLQSNGAGGMRGGSG